MLFDRLSRQERSEIAYFLVRRRHIPRFCGAAIYVAIALAALTYAAIWAASWSRGIALALCVLIVVGALRSALRMIAAVSLSRAPADPLLTSAGRWLVLSRLIEICLFVAAIAGVGFAAFR
jgi:hypothetical protein